MISCRYSRENTSVQRRVLHYLSLRLACSRTANMPLWVQHMVSRPCFEWHTEAKNGSPISHLPLAMRARP